MSGYPDAGPVTVSVVVGTRPEIIKMAPVYFALREAGLSPRLVHSGQHYDYEMSQVFFEELELPEPEVFLGVGSDRPGRQTGSAIIRFEEEFADSQPDCVLVEGDTNTVLAGAIAAMKLRVKLGHVEAGLRSYDLRMPEELNRRLTDHASDYLFAPTEDSVRILKGENVWGKVFMTGNTVIDATVRYLPKAVGLSKILDAIPWDEFAVATLHRAENVDNRDTLANIVKVLTECPVPVVLPLHPRTDSMLRKHSLKEAVAGSENIHLIPPAGYFDMLVLMKESCFILTDSGGIQEEATSPVLQKMVFVMRTTTERPEAVRAGYCKVVGTDAAAILEEVRSFVEGPRPSFKPCPYGDGYAAEATVSALQSEL
jgi:UDP-N-acetylglucosamine 2-epimerase (non-hydrolysing)